MQIPNQDTSFTGDLKQFALDPGCGSGAVAAPAPQVRFVWAGRCCRGMGCMS
jgi:hypothetical protein